MPQNARESDVRAYYDEFSRRYDDQRGDNRPFGYHSLLDDLEVDYVARYGTGKDILEVGCGTGLLLERFARFGRSAQGIDLSPGMLEAARRRGLSVREGSATQLPFGDASFDVTCSFKVLAHVEDIRGALTEMARVTRPSGMILAEFYNPWSIRGLLKRFGPAAAISEQTKESAILTRFDSPRKVAELLPRGCVLESSRGVRIVTPTAKAMDVPLLRNVLRKVEWALADSPASRFGGFWIAAIRKSPRGP